MPRDLYKKRLESLFSDVRFPPAAPAPDAPAPAAPTVEPPAAIPAAEPAPAAEARPTEPSPGASGERGAASGKANGTAVAEAPSAPPLAPSAAATPARRVVTGLLGGGPSDADRFFELSQELLCIVGADGLFKRANPAFERVLGWSVRELTKMAFLDLVHPGDRPTTMAELEKLRQGATAVRVANRFQSANGSDRWISWIVQATGDGALYTTGHDITERRQAEDALRESEARYRSLIEDSHDAVVSVGLDGRFLFFSQVWLNLLGYTAEEMNRKTLFELMRADSLTQCQPLFLQVMGGHAVKQVETVFLTKHGDPVVLEANSTPRFQNGQVVATQTTFRDITARKQAEAELHKFRYALDRSTDAVFITDVQGVILYANQAFERTYGFSREETIGQTPRLIKSGLIPPEQYQVFWQTLQNKQVVAGELINRAKDGRLVPIDGANTPILDGAGQIIGFMAIHRDISERKQADAQLLLQAAALESAANAIVITDPAGLIQWVNPAFTVITGYTLDEVRGRSTRLLKSGLHDAAFYAEMWGVLLAGRTWRGEVTNRRKDGRLYVEDQIITPVTDAQGTIVNYVSTKEDITARKAAEQALRASQAELAEALRIAQLANWEYDVAADLFLFNDQFYALLRTTAEQEGGYTMPSARYAERFVPPEDAALVGQEIGKALATADPDYSAQLDHRIRYADGNEGYVTVRFRVVKDAQGRTVRTIGANQDITERKRAEAAVLAEQQRTQTVLETVSVPMIISRLADSRVLYANQALADIGRIALSELVGGRTVDYFADPADRDKVAAGLQRQGQISNFETRLRRGDGTLYWALLTSRILMYQGERCVLTTYIDITERKAAEAEALAHTAELEALNRLGQAITEEHDFPRLLRRAGDLIMQVFEARSGFIALYDPATGRLEWPYFLDAGTYVEVAPRLRGQGPTSYVIQERRPLLINQDLAARMAELGAYYSGGPEEETARAWLGVPIFVDEAVAGVISVSQPHEQAFDDDDVRLLTTVAASLGAGLQTVRLLEQVRRRVAELAVLNAIVGAAAASLDVTRTLDVAAREVAQLIQARSCGVALLDAAGQTLTVVADHGVLDEPRSVGVVIPVPGNLSSERAIATRQAVVIADAQTDPLTEPIHELMRARQTYALVIVPLLVRQTVIGTIALDSNDPQRQFTPAEVGFLETVARQLAGAIETNRLFEATQRRAAELATVAEVGNAVSALRHPTTMLQAVVDLAKERFALYHAHVYLLNAEGDTLVLAAGAGEVGQRMVAEGRRIPLARRQSLVAQAARDRRAVIVNDVRQDPNFLPHPLLPETRAELAAPLLVGGEMLGVLDVQAAEVGRFTEADANIQTALAAQVAVALENARSFELAEKAYRELNALTRRLSRENWLAYTQAQAPEARAFVYDLGQIQPVQPAAAPEGAAMPGGLVLPLQVQGESVGQLAVAEPALAEDDAAAIAAAVADRLSAHLENLRLTEQIMQSLTRQENLSTQLETVAQVSTVASNILEGQVLLQEVVDLARERFGLYHAQVFLFDEVSETLQLAAGAGDIGRQMAAAGLIIPALLERATVARAARLRQAVADELPAEAGAAAYALLPAARSELAVPMLVGDRLLGVFHVLADRPGAFSLQDARIQGTLAAQVAIALQNANLYAEQAATVARLKELDHLKSSFLANMSHELRTPLNSIIGFTDVILEGLDGPLTDRMDTDLKVVQKNGQHLLNLINDILDMAKIEAGRMTISPEPLDLADVVAEVLDITGSLAREKGLYLTSGLSPDEVLRIEADHTRLRQVLINLVGNSIKFTETGGVTISAQTGADRLRICVQDTGIGIPTVKLESIFEAFSQVDTSTTRKAGGTGLGLPISRHLIELHGGRLWAESRGVPGEGSRFYIELPLEVRRGVLEG